MNKGDANLIHRENIEQNIATLSQQVVENGDRILHVKLKPVDILNIFDRQCKLEQALQWMNAVKNFHFPPTIVQPNQNGMKIIPPDSPI